MTAAMRGDSSGSRPQKTSTATSVSEVKYPNEPPWVLARRARDSRDDRTADGRHRRRDAEDEQAGEAGIRAVGLERLR